MDLEQPIPQRDMHESTEWVVVRAGFVEWHLKFLEAIPENTELLLAVRVVRTNDPEDPLHVGIDENVPDAIRIDSFRDELIPTSTALSSTPPPRDNAMTRRIIVNRGLTFVRLVAERGPDAILDDVEQEPSLTCFRFRPLQGCSGAEVLEQIMCEP